MSQIGPSFLLAPGDSADRRCLHGSRPARQAIPTSVGSDAFALREKQDAQRKESSGSMRTCWEVSGTVPLWQAWPFPAISTDWFF